MMAAIGLAGGAALLGGCASEAAPVTAENSQFRPAGEGEAPTPVEGDATDATRNVIGEKPASDSADASAPDDPAAEGAAKTGAAAPAGDVATLVAFIDKLARQKPQGASQQEQLQDFVAIQSARLDAGKKVLALNPDEQTKQKVVQASMEILMIFNRVGVPTAGAQRLAFAKLLVNDPDKDIARLGRFMIFDANVGKILSQPLSDGKEVVAQVKQLLEAEKDGISPDALELANQASELLRQQGMKEDAVVILELIATTAQNDPKLADQAERFSTHAKIVKADVTGTLLVEVLTGEPEAEGKLIEAIKTLLADIEPSAQVFKEVQEVAYRLEVTGHTKAALECLDLIDAEFKDVTDEKLAEIVKVSLTNARTRLELVGKPFVVEGLLLDGQPFDWSAYAGKVVLVDFWATWCGPCIEEMPNIKKNYEQFKDAGFEVVGVNLDTDVEQTKQFLSLQELPWTSVTSQEVIDGKADPDDFSKLPMAAKCGVDGIPFLVLVGKDGKVDSLHVRGSKLKTRLTQLLGPPAGENPVEVPADPTAPEKPAAEKPAADKPAAAKPAGKPADETSSLRPTVAPSPVALLVAQSLLAADEPPAAKDGKDQPPPVSEDPAVNPYKAKPGLSTAQLVDYIERMFDKPKSIRLREGFTEALVDACDRILTAEPSAKEAEQFIAVESKCEALHRKACAGDEACDKQLMEFVGSLKSDERQRIARQVEFFERERKVLDAAEMPLEQLPELLKELQEYFAKEKLTARHLRMASSTVALINRLEDGDQREEHFVSFGGAFAKASDKELARYGKKLAKKPGAVESDLVGKPLELAGTTFKGANFVWDAYRGKVVIVDFWATWCGPCRREMPNVKAYYEKNADRGFDVVGISLDQDLEALGQYLEENEIPWDNLSGDETQELASKYGVRGIPTMMLVDRDGKVIGVAHSLAALEPMAEKLLAGAKAAEGK